MLNRTNEIIGYQGLFSERKTTKNTSQLSIPVRLLEKIADTRALKTYFVAQICVDEVACNIVHIYLQSPVSRVLGTELIFKSDAALMFSARICSNSSLR